MTTCIGRVSQVVCRKKIKDKQIYLVCISLSEHSEDCSNKLGLTYTVPLCNTLDLSFTNHTHCLKPF